MHYRKEVVIPIERRVSGVIECANNQRRCAMKLRRVTVVGVLALVALVLPVMLVSAAPPGRPFTVIYDGKDCFPPWIDRLTGNAIHSKGDSLAEVTFIDLGGIKGVAWAAEQYNGSLAGPPAQAFFRFVPGAHLGKHLPDCGAAAVLALPDYWEGRLTFNQASSSAIRITGDAKGYGEYSGTLIRGELQFSGPGPLTWVGTILETGEH